MKLIFVNKFRQRAININESIGINLLIVFLSLVSVFLLVYEFSVELSSEQIRQIHNLDLIIVCIFLFDFFIGLIIYPNRGRYLKNNWLDLFSSIPITDGLFRSLRVLRLLRLIRVVRLIQVRRLGKKAYDVVSIESAKYIYLTAVTSAVILSSAISFFTLEVGVNPNVNNFYDAIWWTVAVVTVGPAEIHPVTWEGRLIGMFLMIFGVVLVATLAGFVGHYFLSSKRFKL